MYKISLPPPQKGSYSQQTASGAWRNKGVEKKLSPPLSFYYTRPLQLFPQSSLKRIHAARNCSLDLAGARVWLEADHWSMISGNYFIPS